MKRNRYLLLGVVILVLLAFPVAQATEGEPEVLKYKNLLDDKAIQEIMKRGSFLRSNELVPGYPKAPVAGMIINAPMERIWGILTDYEHYEKIFLSVGKTEVPPEVLQVGDDSFTVRFRIEVAEFPVIKIHLKCDHKCVMDKEHNRINFKWENATLLICPKGIPQALFARMVPKLEGEARDVAGSFEFIPIDEGKRTVVFCTGTADFKDSIVGAKTLLEKFPELEPMMTLSAMRLIMEGVKKAAEKKS